MESGPRESSQPIEKAHSDDVDRLTDVLVRAFDDDPVLNWLLRNDHKRRLAFKTYFEYSLRYYSLPYGTTFTTPNYEGAAIWVPPGKGKFGFFEQLRLLPGIIRVGSLPRLPRVIRAFNAAKKHHPAATHYYLIAIGVDPKHQGRGVGGALLRPVLDLCDCLWIPAYLECSKESGITFYERHGFRVTEEFELGRGSPWIWSMWRKPKNS